MKKLSIIIAIVLLLSLCGCSGFSIVSGNDISTLQGWVFQYNEGTNDYSIFFSLLNQKDQMISADVDVSVRIENDAGETVYNETTAVSKDDFGYYTNSIVGERLLAEFRIKKDDISPGKSSDGTVYLTVSNTAENIAFDEVNCSAYSLPTKDVNLIFDNMPQELKLHGYGGTVSAIIQINEITFEYNKDILSTLKITVSGEKTYNGKNYGYDMIDYKLYDSENNVVDSGSIYLSSLSKGDKFKDDSISFYDAIPGETYRLKLYEKDLYN